MKRRWIGRGAVGGIAGAVLFAAWFPGFRLEHEVAAAKSEGVATDFGDIRKAIAHRLPPGENAADSIREAILVEKTVPASVREALRLVPKIAGGRATPAEEQALRRILLADPRLLQRWRRASMQPQLDFNRKWEQGYGVLFSEYYEIKNGGQRLVAAARLGLDKEENLKAAARLSALLAQEPGVLAALIRVALGRTVLREAGREGAKGVVEPSLGAPIDVRWVYLSEFPSALDSMRRVGDPEWYRQMGAGRDESYSERLRHMGPWRTNAAWRLARTYRELWQEMPKDGTDYETASKAMAHRMPEIYRELGDASPTLTMLLGEPNAQDATKAIEAFRKYDMERKGAKDKPEDGGAGRKTRL